MADPKITPLNDHRSGLIQVADSVDDGLVCEFCGHAFEAGEKFVMDREMLASCPGAAGGFSDQSCYDPRPKENSHEQ